MAGALSGLKVIDMSRYIAGPFCGQLLGDLGADVVKVERIDGGEEGRRVGEAIAGDTFFFLSANRNKRGFAVDFATPNVKPCLPISRRKPISWSRIFARGRWNQWAWTGKACMPAILVSFWSGSPVSERTDRWRRIHVSTGPRRRSAG